MKVAMAVQLEIWVDMDLDFDVVSEGDLREAAITAAWGILGGNEDGILYYDPTPDMGDEDEHWYNGDAVMPENAEPKGRYGGCLHDVEATVVGGET